MPPGPARRSRRRLRRASIDLDADIDRALAGLPRGRRNWKRIVGTAALLLIVAFALSRLPKSQTGHGGGVGGAADWATFDKQVLRVDRVVDGDTVRVLTPAGESESVRLIGVDAPEMRPREGGPPAHYAERATDWLRNRLDGERVTLRLPETRTRDRYGRLLAYVYLDDSEDVGESLVAGGYAYADRRFAHDLRRHYERAEAAARGKKRGLWANVRKAQMPEWRRRWMDEKGFED